MIDNESKAEKASAEESPFKRLDEISSVQWAVAIIALFVAVYGLLCCNKSDEENESVVRAKAEFSELIDFVDSGVKDVTSLLGVSEVTPEVREVVEYSISGEHNGTLKGDVASNLISLVRGAGGTFDESDIDKVMLGSKLDYLRISFKDKAAELSEAADKVWCNNDLVLDYKGKEYSGLDACDLVDAVTEGRL